ncbi:MAG: hypothetical protein ACTSUD_13050 [Alphaproteobacteria bacterium]
MNQKIGSRTMLKKIFVALVMAIAVPVGMTSVTSIELVPEAQAWGLKSIAKKAGKGIKKGAKVAGRKVKKHSVRFVKNTGRAAKQNAFNHWRRTKSSAKTSWKVAKCVGALVCRGKFTPKERSPIYQSNGVRRR